MRTFGTETDNLIDAELEYGTNNYQISWFQNGLQRDIDVSKAVIHFVGAKYPLGNVTIDYLELDTKYLNFLEEDAIRLDIIADDADLTVGTYYVGSEFTKNKYDASYTAYSSLIDLGLKLNTWEGAPESATIGYIVHHFIDALGIVFDTEPISTLTFNASMTDFSSITLGELLGYCACIEQCNYVLRGAVLHKVIPSASVTKEYNMDDIVYSENLSQTASDAILDYIKVNYKTVSRIDEDGQITYEFNDADYICKSGTESCGFELNIGLVPTSESAMQSYFSTYFNSVKGMDCNGYNVSFLGDARVEVGDKLKFYNNDGSAVLNVAELIWEWDGALKCTVSSGTNSISNAGSGYSIQQVVSQIQAMTNAVKNVQFNAVYVNELYAKTAELGFASIKELSVEVAKMGYLNAETADLKYASIDLSNIAAGSIKTAMIDVGAVNTAQIADGSITNAKIVELSANKITAGTLSVERLEIRGSNKSIVYALNNITGALQAQNVNTLNGEILTQRTITADKLVANSITANEIAAKTITANQIAANAVTAEKINVSTLSAITANLGTITAGVIKSANYVAGTTGMKLDLSTGALDSKNTKLDKEGKLTCSNILITGGNIKLRGDAASAFVDISHDTTSHAYNARMNYNGFRFVDSNQQTSMSVNLNASGLSFNGIQVIQNPGQAYPNIKDVYDVKTLDGISLRDMHSDYLPKSGGTMSGTLQNNKSVIVNGCNDYGQFISDYGQHRVMLRNDGSYFYILIGSPGGAWNTLRPLLINLASGSMATHHDLSVSGIIRNSYNTTARTTAAPNCYIDTVGGFYKSSGSSRKFKCDFSSEFNDDLNPENLYDIKVYQYKFKKEYMEKKTDSRYDKDVIGLVAEQVYENYPVAADYTEDENGKVTVHDWNYRYMIPAMLKLLQDQKKEIETLKTLIKAGDE